MILGIDPKVDYAFKHVFGREPTRQILIDLIDHVLDPAPGGRIEEIELLNPFNPKEAFDDKLSIVDIKARDRAGRHFNVEMQMLASPYYEKRILYYWARLYEQQLHQGEDYLELKPTVSISFLGHVLFGQVPDYHLRFRLLESRYDLPLTNDIEFHILELPKFTKAGTESVTGLDRWLYILQHAEKIDPESLPAVFQQHGMVMRALEELKMLAQTDVERERYEARRKALLDYNTGMKAARMEGREEGREEGEKIGRQVGREEGERAVLIRQINFCERILGRKETPPEELGRKTLAELQRSAEDLQTEALKPP